MGLFRHIDLQPREFQAFSAAFQSIHRLIEQLRSTLPPLSHLDPRNPSTRAILLTHALTDAATIKLHNIFSYANSASKQHCLVAAHNLVNFGGLSIQDVGHVNPIMSVSVPFHVLSLFFDAADYLSDLVGVCVSCVY